MADKIVYSVIRAMDVLKALAGGLTRVTDICNRLGLSKPTVHRLLRTLEFSDLVKQNPLNRTYCLGPAFLQLATSQGIQHQYLISAAFEELKRLRDISGETVNLQIPLGTERVCLEEIQSLETIKYVTGKGAVYPIFVGSAGKVLLSQIDKKDLSLIMKKFYFVPSAPNSIKSPELLFKEVEKAEKQGYATSFGERVAGSASVSVPIRDYIVPVAITAMGPGDRFTLAKINRVVKEMKKSAAGLSKDLTKFAMS